MKPYMNLLTVFALMLTSGAALAQAVPTKGSQIAPASTTPPKDTKGIIMTDEVHPI